MKVHIFFTIIDSAWGGGNQFLKILRDQFRKNTMYAEHPETADCVIVNSYQNLLRALILAWRYPQKIFIHRLGPVFSYHRRTYWKIIDRLVVQFTNLVAHTVVFQSRWSLEQAYQFGFNKDKNCVIVGNAVDPTIFFSKPAVATERSDKIKLVATSWSTNPNKGFEYYTFLDTHLDFNKFEFTFIGNCPVTFQHIKRLAAMPSVELANELRVHDIYISAVHNDAYSNGIVEALACGLPVVALDSGGNSEVVGEGGVLFSDTNDLLEKITIAVNRYAELHNKICIKSITEISARYLEVAEEVHQNKKRNRFLLVWLICRAFVVVNFIRLADKLYR